MNRPTRKHAGLVFDIQRFSVHDGPGIRTTVFLKGCRLRCRWCHNPESQDFSPEISFTSSKCIGCGACVAACDRSCHYADSGKHGFRRDGCNRCGRCVEVCEARALEVIGREMSAGEVMSEVMKDRSFYESTGGLTISGGEPIDGFETALAILEEAGRHGLHRCVETSGSGPFERLAGLADQAELILYDIKETDPARHPESVGARLEPILSNLERLDETGAKIILRCPVIPSFNDRPDHFNGIAEIANRLKNLHGIDLMPANPLGRVKYERIGRPLPTDNWTFPDPESMRNRVANLAACVRVPVRRL